MTLIAQLELAFSARPPSGTRQSPTPASFTNIAAVLANLGADSRVCDLGCGGGGASLMLAQQYSANFDLIDVSQKRLDLAARKAGTEGSRMRFLCVDALQHLRTNPGAYDLMLCEGGIATFIGSRSVIHEAAKASRPGAVLCLSGLTTRKIGFHRSGGCDVPQDLPEDVRQQYATTVLPPYSRELPSEDEIAATIEERFTIITRGKASSQDWSDYYEDFYQYPEHHSGDNEAVGDFIRSVAMDESYYKILGQHHLDYSVFIARLV